MNPKTIVSKLSLRKAYSEQLRKKLKEKKNKNLIKVCGNTTKRDLNKYTKKESKTDLKSFKSLNENKCRLEVLFEEPSAQSAQRLGAEKEEKTRCIKPPKIYANIKSLWRENKSTTIKPTSVRDKKCIEDTLKYQYEVYGLKKKLEQ